MKNYININGEKIAISDEAANDLQKQFCKKETKSEDISTNYNFMNEINWSEKEKVLIKDEPKQKIFINQKFADNSTFGNWCVFINCKFGSDCKFENDCEFGSDCEFGRDCEFGSDCKKLKPYWDEEGKH